MSKGAPFKFLKCKLSSQLDSDAFAKIIARKLKKIRSCVTLEF